MDSNYEKYLTGTPFEQKLALCKAKLRHEIDLDWEEIVMMLNLDISADHLRKMAYGLIEYDDYIHSYDGVSTTILSISDLHTPYQLDKNALSSFVGKTDILQLNGDIFDFQGFSKFPKMFRQSPIEELIIGRQYLIDLINYIKPSRVVVNDGNHEMRFAQYLAKNIDNDIQELMPMSALDYVFTDGFNHYDRKSGTKTYYAPLTSVMPEVKFEYSGTWYSVIGKTVFAHPKTFSSSPLKTAEKALLWFRNEGFDMDCLVMAHTHRLGEYKVGNSMIYEQGAFCHTEDMRYNDGLLINSQQKGFIFLCQDENGRLIESKTKLTSLT